MSILDSATYFEPLAGTAITSSAASTNVVDLNIGRDMGASHNLPISLLVAVVSSFTSGNINATLNVQVQAAPDNGSGTPGGWSTLYESGVQYLGQLTAGQKVYQGPLKTVSQPFSRPVTTTFSCSSSAGTITVASATGIAFGQFAVPSTTGIIVPGTTVTGISGVTISLSANTTAAASAGSAIAFAAGFGSNIQGGLPRFLRLNYVVANGPFTAGSLFGGLVLNSDMVPIYAPGVSWPPFGVY